MALRGIRSQLLMKRAFGALPLVVALLVQLGYVVPAHSMARLRAITCCARGCDHARSAARAMRCCGVQPWDDTAMVTPAVAKEMKPQLVAHASVVPSIVDEAPAAPCARPALRHQRAAPLFLVVRSLRL